MRTKAIVSDLEKRDVIASSRSGTSSVEGKNVMIYFSARLN
jgi:hypothetical protein